MLSSRLISGSLATSNTFHSLPTQVQDRFYRYLLLTDEYGCFEANVYQIKGVVWPKRDDVKPAMIDRDLAAFEKSGMLELWDANDGRRYGFWKKFFLFQRLRTDYRQKCPTPPTVEKAGGWAAYRHTLQTDRDALYSHTSDGPAPIRAGSPGSRANPREPAPIRADAVEPDPRQSARGRPDPAPIRAGSPGSRANPRSEDQDQDEDQEQEEAEVQDSPPTGGQRPAPEHVTRSSARSITRARVEGGKVSNGIAAAQAAEVLRYLNGKVDRPFPVAGPPLRLVIERLTDRECPVSAPQLKALIDDRFRRWGRDPERRQHLRPQVLFAEKNCAEWAALAAPVADVKAVGKCFKCGKPAPGSVICRKCKAKADEEKRA